MWAKYLAAERKLISRNAQPCFTKPYFLKSQKLVLVSALDEGIHTKNFGNSWALSSEPL